MYQVLYLSLTKSIMIHFERLIKLLQLQPGRQKRAKEGLDGSGRHSVYNKQGSMEPTQHDHLDVCSSTISHQMWL